MFNDFCVDCILIIIIRFILLADRDWTIIDVPRDVSAGGDPAAARVSARAATRHIILICDHMVSSAAYHANNIE